MFNIVESLVKLWKTTGIYQMLYTDGQIDVAFVKTLIMLAISGVLIYLAIGKGFEPLLLLPIAFGMLLANLPGTGLFHKEFFINDSGSIDWALLGNKGGLMDYLYLGVKLGIYPSLIFLAIGAMTDFTPLIAKPSSLLLGAGAQFGIYVAFTGALALGFSPQEAASIGIIGGADGPTAILVTKTLAPHLLGAIAVAAYSYMALIPIIQPPLMRLVTTKKERQIKMEMSSLRPVSRIEKLVFPVLVAAVVALILPDAAPLVGFLMLGNLLNVCGVTDRLSKTAQNELCNIVTIFLGVSVGITADAESFLKLDTILIIVLGLTAFAFATIGGLILGKIMCLLSGGRINPLIGSAGVSAVPMAARVAQTVGQKENPSNFLLMHAMGPNVAGVIGSAVAAGVFLASIPH
ncbi:MAG: sodium ion-translocating decarboxylase subunit beta [Clostridia bacterium]|nr:sodium ion-translocating decarboxylase subunit beta [Clostridia bacterium]